MSEAKQNRDRTGVLGKIAKTILRRFRGSRGEIEAETTAQGPDPDPDPVTEASEESFPASDPPSFTPEKST